MPIARCDPAREAEALRLLNRAVGLLEGSNGRGEVSGWAEPANDEALR